MKINDEAEALGEQRRENIEFWRKNLSQLQMSYIRKLRVDGGLSWRSVAAMCFREFENHAVSHPSWSSIPSNQLIGMELCEVAAESFGENYMEKPWN